MTAYTTFLIKVATLNTNCTGKLAWIAIAMLGVEFTP